MADHRRSFSDGFIESLEPRVLLSADPVTQDHPLWAMPRGGAVIDGVLDDAAWDSALEIFRTQATRADNAVWVRMMWNNAGVYLSVEARDENIWADGRGGGSGNLWEIETDDSVTFYFDPDGSRDEYLQANDFAFGVNLGSFLAPKNDAGEAVRRFKYIVGDGGGGAPTADFFPGSRSAESGNWEDDFLPPGASYAIALDGTPNDPTDVDVGWTIEMFLPWWTVGFSSVPTHGTTLGMNFDVIFDQEGGARDLTSNRELDNRFEVPPVIDDHVQGVHSSFRNTGAGIRGPINYAEVMLVDARTSERPDAIGDGLTTLKSP
ncbi:MAG: sugar-binding protein, partial [Planctomycetota bacterium]